MRSRDHIENEPKLAIKDKKITILVNVETVQKFIQGKNRLKHDVIQYFHGLKPPSIVKNYYNDQKVEKKSKNNEKIVKTLKKGDFWPGETLKNHLSEKPFRVLLSQIKR